MDTNFDCTDKQNKQDSHTFQPPTMANVMHEDIDEEEDENSPQARWKRGEYTIDEVVDIYTKVGYLTPDTGFYNSIPVDEWFAKESGTADTVDTASTQSAGTAAEPRGRTRCGSCESSSTS